MYLVVMKGMPGSGKTTLSRALGRQLGWPVIDKDMSRPILLDGARAYQVMFLQAQDLLRQGFNVICDSPLTGPKAYGAAYEISDAAQAAFEVFKVLLPPDVAVALARNAGREHKDFDTAVLDEIIEPIYEAFDTGAMRDEGWFIINSSHLSVAETVDEILRVTG